MSATDPFGEGDGGSPDAFGVAVAVVTDVDDPAGLGRIKVRFPWRSSDRESDWTRVAVPTAGPDRGAYFHPEKDDEVLVAFENGDINYPYVLGALWNADAKPPVTTDAQLDVSRIRTRSGHEIAFDDTDSSERVEIVTSGGHRVVLDDESGAERISLEDAAGQSVTLDAANGSVEVRGNSKLVLSAQTVELSGTVEVKIDAGGTLSVTGTPIKLN